MTDMPHLIGITERTPDMAFRDNQSRRLRVDGAIPSERVDAWFSHHIVRRPEDLLAHVQRVHFAASQKNETALYSALLDLFIALGEKGQELRERMLTENSALLSNAHRSFLQASILSGISARDRIADPAMSMLCLGFGGVGQLVEVSASAAVGERDPLRQALESIECSELDEARIILEQSFFNGTSNIVQGQLLLEIYRKTDGRAHFERLYATYDSGSASVPVEWQALADHFAVAP